jgi:hypothetical protein
LDLTEGKNGHFSDNDEQEIGSEPHISLIRRINMKKYAFLVCFFLLMISCAHASNNPTETASPSGVDGWWTGEFQGAHLFYHFKSDGDILTGTADGLPGIPPLHLRDGKIEVNRISFWAETNYGGNKLRADYKGEVKDDEIMFSYTTTVTDPQGNSESSSMPSPLVVHRIGTDNETHDEIEKILKKKIEGGEIAGAEIQTPTAPTLDKAARKEIVIDLAAKLTSDYAIAETGMKMADSLRKKLESGGYDNVTEPSVFARMLMEDLSAVAHDKHLRVVYSSAPLQRAPAEPPPPDMIEKRNEEMRKMNGAITKLEILDGNVGYMRVNGVPMFQVSKDAISAAFAFLKNTDALIIDNRGNGGGDPNTVAWYMSYLSEGAPYVVNTFHHRKEDRIEEFRTTDLGERSYGPKKPVFVLTSPNTFSGGEELTYDIQVFKRGVVVGEVTGGGANPTGPVPLVHNFLAIIPFGYAVNPITESNWEGTGVEPDIEVPAEEALVEAHLLAIKRLQEDASDPMSRSQLDAITFKLELEKPSSKSGEDEIKQEQIAGKYASKLPIPPLTIEARNGDLFLNVPGNPESKLVSVGPNRYKIDGLPDGFFANFRTKDEKIHFLLEQPQGDVLLEKQ